MAVHAGELALALNPTASEDQPGYRPGWHKPPETAALAEVFDVTPRTIQRWANGEKTPDLAIRVAIAAWCVRHELVSPYKISKADKEAAREHPLVRLARS
jgi:transcriptional regulator with XRE-family HTH domain